MGSADIFLFWFLALLTIASAVLVITKANPIFSALALAMTMVGVSALFVTLNAYFLAGVQMIVYAGAVMVLFVMILMLFDLKTEVRAFSRGIMATALKIGTVTLFAGLIVGALIHMFAPAMPKAETKIIATKDLGHFLMTQYLFGFEALGLLLLVVAVGAVALARSKGGTHAKS